MDTQLLHRTIAEQNQVIIAQTSRIKDLERQLEKTKDKLSDAKWEISCQKFDKKMGIRSNSTKSSSYYWWL